MVFPETDNLIDALYRGGAAKNNNLGFYRVRVWAGFVLHDTTKPPYSSGTQLAKYACITTVRIGRAKHGNACSEGVCLCGSDFGDIVHFHAAVYF
jgi:hypothetical protein